MGFLDSFVKTIGYSAFDAYNDEEDYNYRNRGLENTSSNHGWYKCIKCGNSFRKGDMDIDHIIPKSSIKFTIGGIKNDESGYREVKKRCDSNCTDLF